jgi:hypothetical protein
MIEKELIKKPGINRYNKKLVLGYVVKRCMARRRTETVANE